MSAGPVAWVQVRSRRPDGTPHAGTAGFADGTHVEWVQPQNMLIALLRHHITPAGRSFRAGARWWKSPRHAAQLSAALQNNT